MGAAREWMIDFQIVLSIDLFILKICKKLIYCKHISAIIDFTAEKFCLSLNTYQLHILKLQDILF